MDEIFYEKLLKIVMIKAILLVSIVCSMQRKTHTHIVVKPISSLYMNLFALSELYIHVLALGEKIYPLNLHNQLHIHTYQIILCI